MKVHHVGQSVECPIIGYGCLVSWITFNFLSCDALDCDIMFFAKG